MCFSIAEVGFFGVKNGCVENLLDFFDVQESGSTFFLLACLIKVRVRIWTVETLGGK